MEIIQKMNNMEIYIYIGIAAWVYTNILIAPDMIFNKLNYVYDKLPSWLSKPLGVCEYCFAGQIAFWHYIIVNIDTYNLFTHILMTSLSIFMVELINIIYIWKNLKS